MIKDIFFLIFSIPSLLTGVILGWGFCLIDYSVCLILKKPYTKGDTNQNFKDADYLLIKTGLFIVINIVAWVTVILIVFL